MTTLSEYKAIMEGATDAPWECELSEYYFPMYVKNSIGKSVCRIDGSGEEGDVEIRNNIARFIATSRNIATELIRVIELAEDALNRVRMHKCMFDDDNQFNDACDRVNNALSEIRKLKGE